MGESVTLTDAIMIALIFVLVVLVGMAAVVGSVVKLPAFAKFVRTYQTLISGCIAILAAVIATVGVYGAASLPIFEERRLAEHMSLAEQKRGAAVLLIGINELAIEIIEVRTGIIDASIAEIPKVLIDRELIFTQKPSQATTVALGVTMASGYFAAEKAKVSSEVIDSAFEDALRYMRIAKDDFVLLAVEESEKNLAYFDVWEDIDNILGSLRFRAKD